MVSVIIPVYNTEDYLEECISSVMNQDYHDLEVILINDGSTDGSGSICRKWEGLDSRIRYIEKENEGQGVARNQGIRMAAGEYIIFVDSDDFIEPDLVSRVYNRITEEKADICVYASSRVGEMGTGSLEFKLAKGSNVKENKEMLGQMTPILCNKMFAAALMQNADISMDNRMCEDLVFNARVYMRAKKICFLDCPLYHYRGLREGNFSTNYRRYNEVEESIQNLNEIFLREGWFEEYWQQLYEITFTMFKIILFRIGVWKAYQVPQEVKSRYPDFFHSYQRFLNKWYARYLTMEMQEKKFLLVGSYSLRVIVHHMLLNEGYRRDHYAASSIVSLMSDPYHGAGEAKLMDGKIPVDDDGDVLGCGRWKNPYRKRCVEQDVRKTFRYHAGLGDMDYVAVDLMEEVSDLIQVGEGCYVTESAFFREVVPEGLEDYRRIPFVSLERRDLFRKYAPLFAERLIKAGVSIIVVKNFLCERHSGYYDWFEEYDFQEKIRETNRELEWCYEYLLRYLPEAIVADAAELHELEFTQEDFPYGKEPIYYNSVYYQRMAIKVIQRIHDNMESVRLERLNIV